MQGLQVSVSLPTNILASDQASNLASSRLIDIMYSRSAFSMLITLIEDCLLGLFKVRFRNVVNRESLATNFSDLRKSTKVCNPI